MRDKVETQKPQLDTLETRDTPAALVPADHAAALGAVHLPAAQIGRPAAAAGFQVIDTLERQAQRLTFKSITSVGGQPGTKVVLQADLTGGTPQQLRNQTITFTIGGRRYTATTNSSGHAQVDFTIPRGAQVGQVLNYTAQFGGMTAYATVLVRR